MKKFKTRFLSLIMATVMCLAFAGSTMAAEKSAVAEATETPQAIEAAEVAVAEAEGTVAVREGTESLPTPMKHGDNNSPVAGTFMMPSTKGVAIIIASSTKVNVTIKNYVHSVVGSKSIESTNNSAKVELIPLSNKSGGIFYYTVEVAPGHSGSFTCQFVDY